MPSSTKKSPPAPIEEHSTVPVRVSPTVHKHITAKAIWGESIDKTLRRLLRIPEAKPAGAAK